MAISCLMLTKTPLKGQSSSIPAKGLLEQILQKSTRYQTSDVEGRPPVSRKRTPKTGPSRKREPAPTREKESGRSSQEEGHPKEAPSTEERESSRRPRQETRKRRTPDDYPRHERIPSQRDRTDEECRRQRHPEQESKAKCGVPGCQHPGKHKGLHKKNGIRPIRFGK